MIYWENIEWKFFLRLFCKDQLKKITLKNVLKKWFWWSFMNTQPGTKVLNFFVQNLRIFTISSSVCPWQAFTVNSYKHSSFVQKSVNYGQKSFITKLWAAAVFKPSILRLRTGVLLLCHRDTTYNCKHRDCHNKTCCKSKLQLLVTVKLAVKVNYNCMLQ